jgi:cytochrome c-type biogenesis protein CcmH
VSARRLLAAAAGALTLALAPLAAPAAAAPRPGLTVTGMEQDFMCVVCREALDVAQAPEADSERTEIGRLIGLGDTRAQIDRAMVAQFGSAVLALPKAQGFNVVLYVLPPVLVAAGLAALAVLLPRWRRRARAGSGGEEAEAAPAGPAPGSAEARRLEEELARYDG